MKTIEQHNKEAVEKYRCSPAPEKTGVQCPHCGSEMLYENRNVQLLTYPPQARVYCNGCNYRTLLYV